MGGVVHQESTLSVVWVVQITLDASAGERVQLQKHGQKCKVMTCNDIFLQIWGGLVQSILEGHQLASKPPVARKPGAQPVLPF